MRIKSPRSRCRNSNRYGRVDADIVAETQTSTQMQIDRTAPRQPGEVTLKAAAPLQSSSSSQSSLVRWDFIPIL